MLVPALVPHTYSPGGEAAMRKPEQQCPAVGNVVKRIQDGNTTVIICDDYVERTPDGIERVLANFDAALWAIVDGLRKAGEDI